MNSECWNYLTVAARLKQTLELVPGASVDAKSKTLGFSAPSVYSYLSGKNKFPLEFMIKLREITDVNLDWLLTGEGEQFKGQGCKEPMSVIDPDYFVLVCDAVDDFLGAELVVGIGSVQYSDLLVFAYNSIVSKVEYLSFSESFESIVPLLKDRLSSIKEIGRLKIFGASDYEEFKINAEFFSEITLLVNFFLNDKLKGDLVDRFRFVPLVVDAYNRLLSLEGSSSDEILKAFTEIVPWLNDVFDEMDKPRQMQLRFEREMKKDENDADGLIIKALELIDQKLEDFAKANNLAPPKSEK